MKNLSATKAFEKLVKNKFNLYNSLFLNLPFRGITNIGILIPLLNQSCEQGLKEGKGPLEIIESFFQIHTNLKSEKEKIDFMIRVIQYIERQIVLYDSVEDAAFSELVTVDNQLTLKDYIHLLKNNKKGDALIERLSTFSTRIVFTAHPTQFYAPAVLDIIAKLKTLITKNAISKIDLKLQQLGLTSLLNSKKPTPFEEAQNIIYFLRNVYYDAVGQLYADIRKNLASTSFDNHNIIELGFWPGGDRDGNPFVTSETTMNVADELRMTLMKCYYQDIKSLEQKLSFRGVEELIDQLRTEIYPALFDPSKIVAFDNIINPLHQIREILIRKYSSLYLDDLDDLIDKVKIFKIHFAVLDIRQNHTVHLNTVEAIFKQNKRIENSIDELERDELISILLFEDLQVNVDDYNDELIKDTIRTIAQLQQIQERNGEEGCNRYIISNSEDVFSVLFVYGLLRWCSWGKDEIKMDIIPLFESMAGMANSEHIMRELFEIEKYRDHVQRRNNTQTVMLGFSDGTKDGGYLQANWSIFRTKENLSAVCNDYDIKAIFFDGRGGPPARGGGKTHRFYASQSQNIANHAIQLTIQGQTITSKYGTVEHFVNNIEQLITAGLSHTIFDKENIIDEESRALIEQLGKLSFEKYNELKHHQQFIPYLENKSTLKYYSEANIGSRPARRSNKEKLELSDLRAIPFVGSWSQLKQNVPGYFGIGTALKMLVDQGNIENLKHLFKEVPYFKALILNSMMSLSKCNFELTRYIANDPEYKDFWYILFDEYMLAKEMVLLISDYTILMEEELISRSSIEIREKIVLPLLVIQQYALQKIEQNSEVKLSYDKIVTRSLYGNINAGRNSV